MFLMVFLPMVVEKTAVIYNLSLPIRTRDNGYLILALGPRYRQWHVDFYLWLLELPFVEVKGEAGLVWVSSRGVAGPSMTKGGCLLCTLRSKNTLLP